MNRTVAGALALALTIALSPSPSAAQAAAHRLDYRAPSACPDQNRLADEVSARVGYLAFGTSGPVVEVRVAVDQTGRAVEYVGTVSIAGDLRAFRSGSCDDLVGTMGAALAVALDPSSNASVATPSPSYPDVPSAPMGGVRLQVSADPDGPPLVLHRVVGRAVGWVGTANGSGHVSAYQFEELCEAPCEARIEAGRHQLAVSQGTGAPLPLADAFRLDTDSALALSYDNRNDLRGAGLLLMIGAPLLGSAGLAGIAIQTPYECDAFDCHGGDIEPGGIALISLGIGVMTTGFIAGMVMLFLQDSANIEVQPLR